MERKRVGTETHAGCPGEKSLGDDSVGKGLPAFFRVCL